jgi:hypothetical protein
MTDLFAIPQKHSDVLAGAWCSHNRQLAERFSQAMKKVARARVAELRRKAEREDA